MQRILATFVLGTLLGLCPAARGEECDSCPAGNCACVAGPGCLTISDRGPLAQEIGAQRCCAKCAAGPCWCPDDYCPKPLPCPPCKDCNCCCDDYCPKPMPCPPCKDCNCCCDDYCPKPAPNLCIPLRRDFLKCVPTR
jgi:hypothetical protein